MNTTLHELHIRCPHERVNLLSEALEALEALSVCVEDADAHSADEQALFGEPGQPAPEGGWQRNHISALFATRALAEQAQALLPHQDFWAQCQLLDLRAVPDQDWVRLTQAQFAPVQITPQLWIVPSWHAAPEGARTIIHLDPGLAFGTGTHPTTRMCLRWLARQEQSLGQVLDYGCGSGILAIAAAKLGAAAVDAVDIDPAAVQSTRDNARANAVALRHLGLPEAVRNARGSYDTVLANILAAPLKVLAPLLCAHLRGAGSHLLLAGLLERQAKDICTVYAPHLPQGVRLHVADQEDGWVLLASVQDANE